MAWDPCHNLVPLTARASVYANDASYLIRRCHLRVSLLITILWLVHHRLNCSTAYIFFPLFLPLIVLSLLVTVLLIEF